MAPMSFSSRKADACDEVTNSINEEYPATLTIPCNISEKEQLQNLVDKTREHFGQIDVLVCNAALNHIWPGHGLPG